METETEANCLFVKSPETLKILPTAAPDEDLREDELDGSGPLCLEPPEPCTEPSSEP